MLKLPRDVLSRSPRLQIVVCGVLLACSLSVTFRVFRLAILASRSDIAMGAVQRVAEVARNASFLTPHGGVDPFQLNSGGIRSDRVIPVCQLSDQPSALAAIARLWELSGHDIEFVREGVSTRESIPLGWLGIHLAFTGALVVGLASKAGLLGERGSIPSSVGLAWMKAAAISALAAVAPWFFVGLAESFWAALWWHWQGSAWIITNHGALSGPTIGATIFYGLLTFAITTRALQACGSVHPSSADGVHGSRCARCGYPCGGMLVCPECGPLRPVTHASPLASSIAGLAHTRRARAIKFSIVLAALLAYAAPLWMGVGRALVLLVQGAVSGN